MRTRRSRVEPKTQRKNTPKVKGLKPTNVYGIILFFFQAEDGIRDLYVTGVQTCALPIFAIAVATQGMKEHLGAQNFWPLYEELQRLNVPLCVHNRREGPAGDNRFDSFIYMHTIGRPVETFIQFAGLIYGGVPEQFPKLRIAFLECGVGWVPYWMERMDEEWEKRGKIEAPRCKKKPSDYVKSGNLFFALEPEEETVPYVIERIGADKILFASDYPHWDGIFPHVVSTIRGRKDISDDAKTQILGQNAKRFYGWQ